MRPDALEPVPTHVADTIEDALRLAAHRLDGIQVVRRYDEVEPILAHPGQLTQVWTNLITNAADAPAGQGVVTMAVSQRGLTIDLPAQPPLQGTVRHQLTEFVLTAGLDPLPHLRALEGARVMDLVRRRSDR